MAAVFNDSKTNEKTKCAVKRINLDKGAENIQNIAQVRNPGLPRGFVYLSPNCLLPVEVRSMVTPKMWEIL